jgi:hypothetical protein
MYVVRLKSIDGIANLKAFRSWTLAVSRFETGQSQVIDDILNESALFDVTSTSEPGTATRLVREGRIAASRIYPPPMTQTQAAAWLADFYL